MCEDFGGTGYIHDENSLFMKKGPLNSGDVHVDL